MERLQEILALLADQEQVAALSDEELAALDDELVQLAEDLAGGDLNDDVLAALQQIGEATQQVRQVAADRETEAERLAAEASEQLARIRGQAEGDGDGEGEGAAGDGDADAGADGDAGDADAEGDGDAGDGADQAEAIAAGAAPIRPRLSSVRSRAPQHRVRTPLRVQDVAEPREWGLVASANMGDSGIRAGERLDDPSKLARAFQSAIEATTGYSHGPRVKVPVARSGSENLADLYPEERILDMNVVGNHRKIEGVTGMNALLASGGICAPINVSYDLPVVGDDDRPVRDVLARFGADRGGVRTIPPPVITDLDGAVGIWTEANDVSPSSPTVKPCLTVTCPDEDETLVEAITLCLETGNFRARFFPEQIDAWMRLAAVNQARRAENQLLGKIGSTSTQVTSGQLLGTTRDVLTTLDRAVAVIRSRHRISTAFPLRFIAPFWLLAQMRTDLARELPGASSERLAIADAEIEAFIRTRNVNVTWTLDGEAGQVFGVQGDAPLIGWPSTVITYLYPEGSWLFLDGGTLDLGIVRDSTLNATNDLQMFSETFEGAHFHGVETWRLAMDVCPDGTTSGTVDIDPCTTGS